DDRLVGTCRADIDPVLQQLLAQRVAIDAEDLLAQHRVKQNRLDAGMTQDRPNQLALPVEADVPPNQAPDVVGHESPEQLVDLVVRQLAEETTDTARDPQVRA